MKGNVSAWERKIIAVNTAVVIDCDAGDNNHETLWLSPRNELVRRFPGPGSCPAHQDKRDLVDTSDYSEWSGHYTILDNGSLAIDKEHNGRIFSKYPLSRFKRHREISKHKPELKNKSYYMNLKHKHASYIYAFKTIVTSLKFKYYDLFYFKVRVKHFEMRDFSTSLFLFFVCTRFMYILCKVIHCYFIFIFIHLFSYILLTILLFILNFTFIHQFYIYYLCVVLFF